MNLQTFFEKFDLFADAPDAVTKMRELVLLWSVRGRLSEQNVAETCTEQKTRARTFSFKNRREFLSPIDDAPFDVPSNWGWVAVGNAMNLVNGTAFKPVNWTPKGTPIVRIQNLNNEEAPFNRFDGEIDPKFYIDSGDFLIN